MSSTIKTVLCKTCLILIIGFTFLPVSYAHAQQQTVVVHVDGDNGLAVPNPPDPGDTWGNAFKYLPDAIARAAVLANPLTTVELWVAETDVSNPYRPDRDADFPGGTGNPQSTFLVNFNNVQLLGGFPLGGGDLEDRDPAVNITVLSGQISEPFGCGDPGAGDCYVDNNSPACDNVDCCETVCAWDPDCCEVVWDQHCADRAELVCYECGVPGTGDCLDPDTGIPTCEDLCNGLACPGCCEFVCALDPLCCLIEWDQTCVNIAVGCPPPPAGDPPRAYHVVRADGVDDTVRIDGVKIILGLADGAVGNDVGAGMFISNASLAVVRVIFTANAAPGHGGGAMNITGTSDPLVVNCEFIANTGNEAGALHTEGGLAGGTFVNCLFSKNISVIEGGAINPGANGDLTFINCTFADNTVVDDPFGGGAIFTERSQNGDVDLINCILWGNKVNGVPNQIKDPELVVTVSYSDVEGTIDPGWDGGNNITDDPMFVDAPKGDYRILIGSMVIDKGDPIIEGVIPDDIFDIDNDNDTLEPTPDLDLSNRVLDGGDNGEDRVDMGSYEFIHPNECPWDLDGGGFVGAGDLLLLLADWGNPYGAADLLDLLAAWGACPSQSFEPPSLQEELDDACLSSADWQEFLDAMANGTPAEQENYICWLTHYFEDCTRCICIGQSGCPGADPFDD